MSSKCVYWWIHLLCLFISIVTYSYLYGYAKQIKCIQSKPVVIFARTISKSVILYMYACYAVHGWYNNAGVFLLLVFYTELDFFKRPKSDYQHNSKTIKPLPSLLFESFILMIHLHINAIKNNPSLYQQPYYWPNQVPIKCVYTYFIRNSNIYL